MAYTPQTWADSPATSSPLSAARLNTMEAGIAGAHTLADAINGGNPLRKGVYTFDICNNRAALGATPLTTRRPFILTQQPIRARVHIRGYDLIADTSTTGTISNVTCFIGPAAINADGDLDAGKFSAAPVQILTATNMVAGAEIITPWFTTGPTGTVPITPYKRYLLSFGQTMTATDQIATGGGVHFYSFNAADAGATAPTLTKAVGQGFHSVYIEYEFANWMAPIIYTAAGNSLTGGAGNSRGEMDAWPQQWARMNGGVAINLAAGGGWASMYGATSNRWNYYSTIDSAVPLAPDYLLFMASASSDIAGGDGSAGAIDIAQASLTAAVAKAQALFPNAKTVLTTLTPRVESTAGALENARLAANAWLTGVTHIDAGGPAGLPFGAMACVDLEPLLSDGATPARLHTLVNLDNTHPNARGHYRIADALPMKRRLVYT